jgi:glucose-6-phosphate isomerase
VHIVDNVDPAHLAEFYGHLPLDRTVFNVITKSGGTPETVTQFLIARRLLEDAQPKDFHRRIWITTDPEKGDLRDVARDEGFPTLPVPSDVGGRFSVLSPVGLLPACVAGVDIRALLDGSADFDAHWRAADPRDNPAYRFAAVNWVLHRRKKKSIVVLLSYSQKLYDVADWFRQLWAESLGKRLSLLGEEVFAGTTPVRALGTTDQHSQIQLYTEGPNDKFIVFLRLEDMGGDLEIPALYPDRPSLAYLGGHRVSELFHAEFLGTETALVEADRPSARLTLPLGNPRSLGWLLQMLQTATVAAGHLYGVNPFDQPGVERGKVVAAALLGKPGLEELRRELTR